MVKHIVYDNLKLWFLLFYDVEFCKYKAQAKFVTRLHSFFSLNKKPIMFHIIIPKLFPMLFLSIALSLSREGGRTVQAPHAVQCRSTPRESLAGGRTPQGGEDEASVFEEEVVFTKEAGQINESRWHSVS